MYTNESLAKAVEDKSLYESYDDHGQGITTTNWKILHALKSTT